MTDAPVFLYLHIPKTGGSTLGEILFTQYHDDTWRKEEGGYFHAGLYYLPDGFIRADQPDLTEQDARVLRRPDLTAVVGHFAFGLHAFIGRPMRSMTLLREPVQRVLSLYHHLRQYDQLPKGMTLEQFVTTPYIHEACNDQVRRLAGTNTGEPCDHSTLDRAKANLNQSIDMVGITERFDASLLLAKHVFDWTGNINYIPRLVNTKRREKPTEGPADIALIERHNALDVELYRHANALLDQRIAALGAGFDAELKAFTRKNQDLLQTHGPSSTVS